MLTDPEVIGRIRSLVIPPAWEDVWICPDERGHIQATGTDAAGRRQYRYHDAWRERRDAEKFEHVLDVAERLPRLRETVSGHLGERGLTRERVLAAAVRLLDLGAFRIGGEAYAAGDDASYGLATLLRDHVAVRGSRIRFCYPAKGGAERELAVTDADVAKVVRSLCRRTSDEPELLAFRNGRGWRDIRSEDINTYLREVTGCEISAKDFRTWQGTLLAATGLALAGPTGSATARKRAVSRVMREVAEHLGNTPAVARTSYVDPRVVDLYHDGVTVSREVARLTKDGAELGPAALQRIERAVLSMIRNEAS